MQRLTGMDASFLYLETPNLHMHVVGVLVCDPSTMSGGFSFHRMRDLIEARFPVMPQFRKKLRDVPLNIAHPVWIDDPDFDLNRHISHHVLPHPGTMHQLADLVGEFAGVALERDRPLWRMMVVDGLEHGNVALVTKIHHSTIDGVTGSDLMAHLFDLEPDVAPAPEPPAEEWEPEPEPSTLRVAADAVLDRLTNPFETGRALVRTGRSMLNMAGGALGLGQGSFRPALPFSAPRTLFNRAVTPSRTVAFGQAQLADLKAVKAAFGTTVNDVVLTACTISLRRYLEAHDEVPDRPLLCSVPVSVHGKAQTRGTNQVSNMFVRLPVHLDDPVDQLLAVHAETKDAKEAFNAMGADLIQDLAQMTPPGMFNLGARLYAGALAGRLPPLLNLIISNVPGPPVPLYLGGARVVGVYPFGPLLDSTGVNITVLSNMGNVDFGVIADGENVSDVWSLADGFSDAVEDLVQAARTHPTGVGRN